MLFRVHQLLLGYDLRAQRGRVDRRCGGIRGQHVGGRLQLEALHLGRRNRRLHRAAYLAPHVEGVGDVKLALVEAEALAEGLLPGQHRPLARLRTAHLLPRARQLGGDCGEERAPLGDRVLLRLAQRLRRGFQRWVLPDRRRHQRGQGGRAEQAPPIAGHVRRGYEHLVAAGLCSHAAGAGRQARLGEPVDGRRGRPSVVRPDGASRQHGSRGSQQQPRMAGSQNGLTSWNDALPSAAGRCRPYHQVRIRTRLARWRPP